MSHEEVYHVPVLLEESMDALVVEPDGVYVDATMGGAGHTRAILERLSSRGRLFSFDQDGDAAHNAPSDKRCQFVASNFRYLPFWMEYYGITEVSGILADLGVSSHHFDTPERGFSFRFVSTVLDMRMNSLARLSAQEILATYSEEALRDLFRRYGELSDAGRIASLIAKKRAETEIATSQELIALLEEILPKQPQQRHRKLSRIYQSLRIEVNDELGALEEFLCGSLDLLAPGGRLVVLTYHSLEDRIVKEALKKASLSTDTTEEALIYGEKPGRIKLLASKGAKPSMEEIASNSRASSAKMRVAERRK